MKEIRLHGLGGLGTVKAGEILVYAAVMEGKFGNSIPFFGFEREGAPVVSFVRLDDKPIRPKNQVYEPNCVIVLEPAVMNAVDVYEGLAPESILVLNTTHTNIDKLKIPSTVKKVGLVDATKIALETLGRPITNTTILASFAKVTGWVDVKYLKDRILEMFGERNVEAFNKGYELTKFIEIH